MAGCAWLIVNELASLGCAIDLYLSDSPKQGSSELHSLPQVRHIEVDSGWRYDRWYSSHRFTKTLTGLASRAWGRFRVAQLLLRQHKKDPYDVIYQFSTIEVFGLRRHLHQLPPLVLHPSTHMEGELRWVRRERKLARKSEPYWHQCWTELLLAGRAYRQRRDIKLADHVICLSKRFSQHLIADYQVDLQQTTVIPNPINLMEISPAARYEARRPRRVLFVSRLSARKGVELVVELSHRLADLEGAIILDMIGGPNLWSNYAALLSDLYPGIARYSGGLERTDLISRLRETDLLVHPAKYEPFGLTVAEALACGVPVVVTDEVGAAESVSGDCCISVPVGDIESLEAAVRMMLKRIDEDAVALRAQARTEAERLFCPKRVGQLVFETLTRSSLLPRR